MGGLEKLLAYEVGLQGVTDEAVCETAIRFLRGDVHNQNRAFAPSIAEFVHEAIGVMEVQRLRKQEQKPALSYRPGPLAPYQITYQRKLAENAHLPVIKDNVSYDEWRRMSRAREIPTGAMWVSATGIVYGPYQKTTA